MDVTDLPKGIMSGNSWFKVLCQPVKTGVIKMIPVKEQHMVC